MTATLIIARHGNTFEPHETPTRVGRRTDLPLAAKGRDQAKALGAYLRAHDLIPDLVLTSELQRTIETAALALAEIGAPVETHALPMFNEIDYGPDENQSDADVIVRIGADALKNWDMHAVPPEGWVVDTGAIIRNWTAFANEVEDGGTTLVVTSNGIARFAPHITGDFAAFQADHDLKLATGALAILERNGVAWSVKGWNIRP